jgi:hypothetical protein
LLRRPEGEEFLRVHGLVDGHEVGLETRDFVEFFEAHDGEGGGSEAVFASVLGGAGLSFQGARAGRTGGIGAIGGKAPGRNGFASAGHGVKSFRFEE